MFAREDHHSDEEQSGSVASSSSSSSWFGRGAFRGDQLDNEVFSLALPALGALAVDPLLSVVDAFYVGQLGATELGAMGAASVRT